MNTSIFFLNIGLYSYIFQEDNIKKHKETFLQEMDGEYIAH